MAEWAAKRFWTSVTAVPVAGGHAVRLDDRPLNTPAKVPLILPTGVLAEAVVAEWRVQGDRIDPLSMPFTRSANAAIDKVAPQREAVVAMIAEYCATDLLCYRAEAPGELVAQQSRLWDPLLDWTRARFAVPLAVTHGVMPVTQRPETLTALGAAMAPMSDFELAGFHDLVGLSGSYVIALAVASGHVTPETGWELSRIDEDWQAAQWGHDDEADEKAALKRAAFLHAHRFADLAGHRATA